VPGGGGRFEVFVDGKRIWSKLESGEFPDFEAMLEQVQGLHAAAKKR
jgi:selT/selW/selH-like putative selenoprotein